MKSTVVFLFLYCSSFYAYGQKGEPFGFAGRPAAHWQKSIGIPIAIEQFSNSFFHIGFVSNRHIHQGCVLLHVDHLFGLDVSYNPFQKIGGLSILAQKNLRKYFIVGGRISEFISSSAPHYVFTPYIGFIFYTNLSVTYGYNCGILRPVAVGINKHAISLQYEIRLM